MGRRGQKKPDFVREGHGQLPHRAEDGGTAPAKPDETPAAVHKLPSDEVAPTDASTETSESEAEGLDPFEGFQAEGLEPIEALFVATTATSARIDAATRSDARFAASQRELLRAIAASRTEKGLNQSLPSEVLTESVDSLSRLGFVGEVGFHGSPGSPEEEKFAVRVALRTLAGVNPKVLADAMGAALSTLYSYSDLDRPNRPGQKRLYQAAYLFSQFADEMRRRADYLTEVARRTSPSRSNRSKTFPIIAGKRLTKKDEADA